jgi:hypothetical protein
VIRHANIRAEERERFPENAWQRQKASQSRYVDVRNHAHGRPAHDRVARLWRQVVVERHYRPRGRPHAPEPGPHPQKPSRRRARPRLLAEITMPSGTHSHKVRVHGDIMITNREILGPHALHGEVPPDGYYGGLSIYDIANPAKPRLITHWDTTDGPGATYARGVHRFDFDGRYAYISPTMDGYIGNIVMILDLKNPSKPEEVGRWWMPGQWIAGGEAPTWKGDAHKCHHPLRFGNRLNTSYWQGGLVILDIRT